MPLDLAALARKSATVEVEYAGERFAVRYRPHVFTVAVNAELNAQLRRIEGDEDRAIELVVGVLTRLVEWWDVTEEGVPVPPDADGLSRFPLKLLLTIIEAIKEDVADPNRQARTAETTPSSSGSPPAVLSVIQATGTRLS